MFKAKSLEFDTSTTQEKLAKMIDHTQLDPAAEYKKIEQLCDEALRYGFYAVCVNPCHVSRCTNLLNDSDVKIACVVGFPFGATTSEVKALEARNAIENGAHEIDMVINVGALRSGDYELVKRDIEGVVKAAQGKMVKVIIESGFLTDEEIVKACELSKEAGAHFVKTSTGFGPMGATPKHVKLMRKTVGKDMGVKAAGGIRDFRAALRLIKAGASRLGTTASVPIIDGMDWMNFSDSWFVEEIPCKICPSRFARLDRLPSKVFNYYKEKCRTCPNKEYNRFYEK